jgi:hypothetical protein
MPSREIAPTRRPRRSSRSGSSIGSGGPRQVESQTSGPAITRNAKAQSRTVRAKGPTWSSELAKATTP